MRASGNTKLASSRGRSITSRLEFERDPERQKNVTARKSCYMMTFRYFEIHMELQEWQGRITQVGLFSRRASAHSRCLSPTEAKLRGLKLR